MKTVNIRLNAMPTRTVHMAWLASHLSDDEHDGTDGGISIKVEDLEANLFEQSALIRRW